jgi:hypothetical protein
MNDDEVRREFTRRFAIAAEYLPLPRVRRSTGLEDREHKTKTR